MCNLGDLVYDADAVYVNIPDSAVRFSEKKKKTEAEEEEEAEEGWGEEWEEEGEESEGIAMVRSLQKVRDMLDRREREGHSQYACRLRGGARSGRRRGGESEGNAMVRSLQKVRGI